LRTTSWSRSLPTPSGSASGTSPTATGASLASASPDEQKRFGRVRSAAGGSINLNRALDIGLSIAAGAIVALTIALALLVITADDESVFDDPDQFPSVLEEGSVGW
jgi:hypothetical protein